MNQESDGRQTLLPFPLALIDAPGRPVSNETLVALRKLLSEAEEGKLTGLALVALYRNGRFHTALEGEALQEGNQMGVVGMLAALQKIALELY